MDIRIGERIKKLRNSRGLTQAALAGMIGVTTSAVSSYEVSERQPSYDVLINLSTCLNVSTDYLIGVTRKDTIDITDLTEKQKNIIRETITEFLSK